MSEIAFDPPVGLPDISTMEFWTAPRDEREAGFAERYTGDVQLLLEKPARRAAPVLGALGSARTEAS